MQGKRNIRLLIQYEGGAYHGWQIQPGALTIQEVLEETLSRIIQERPRIIGAGRTDAGVHALAQVAHLHTGSLLPARTMQRALNALLPHDIRVLMAEETDWAFHARFSALAKRYEYRLWSHPVESVFQRKYSWWIPRPLDFEAMKQASKCIPGEHDFVAFKASGSDARSTVRRVLGCGWEDKGPLLVFWIEATGFLRYMVRGLVGTLVEIGLGRKEPHHLEKILSSGQRSLSGPTAPARGLFLTGVMYPQNWSFRRPWEEEAWRGFAGI